MIIYQQLILDDEGLIMEMSNHNINNTLLHFHLKDSHKSKGEGKVNGLHLRRGEY